MVVSGHLRDADASPPESALAPMSIAELGVEPAVATEVVLRHLLRSFDSTLAALSARIGVSIPVLEALIGGLRAERLVEIARRGSFDADVAYQLTESGRQRAEAAMATSQYVGPMPVSLADYVARVALQRVQHQRVSPQMLAAALEGLVLSEELFAQLGAALNSFRPIFLHGASGTGKTWLAEHLVGVISGAIWVPHAVTVGGEIIQIFDPACHRRVDAQVPERAFDRARQPDARWVRVVRPVVTVGGELSLSMMDLQLDPVTRFYRAPVQLKANNGVLIFDDLGRQRSAVHEILNRWIVPLDRRVDHLALHTGLTFQVPFDMVLVFSSNLVPSSLADPAFVRRLGYKIALQSMSAPAYRSVFAQACARHGVVAPRGLVDFVIERLHRATGTPMMPAYPFDLVMKVVDRARFEGVAPVLDEASMVWAWNLYFAPDGDPADRADHDPH